MLSMKCFQVDARRGGPKARRLRPGKGVKFVRGRLRVRSFRASGRTKPLRRTIVHAAMTPSPHAAAASYVRRTTKFVKELDPGGGGEGADPNFPPRIWLRSEGTRREGIDLPSALADTLSSARVTRLAGHDTGGREGRHIRPGRAALPRRPVCTYRFDGRLSLSCSLQEIA